MQRWQVVVASCLVGMVLVSAGARADARVGGDAVVLEVDSCPGVSAQAIRHILGIEIGDLLVGADQAAPTTADRLADRLTFRCAGNTAWVEASVRGGSNPADRTLRLDDFPGDAAPRALALAGIELLASLSPAVRARTQAKSRVAPPEAPTPRPVAPGPSPERSRHLRLGLAGSWRTFFVGHGVSAWGGQAQLGWAFGERWYAGADLELAGTRQGLQLGEASTTLFSGSVALGLRGGGRRVTSMVGLGARVGLARLAGSTSEASVSATSVTRPWGGPEAQAGVAITWGVFAVSSTVEAGYSMVRAEGLSADAPVLTVGGAWAGISLGAGWRP